MSVKNQEVLGMKRTALCAVEWEHTSADCATALLISLEESASALQITSLFVQIWRQGADLIITPPLFATTEESARVEDVSAMGENMIGRLYLVITANVTTSQLCSGSDHGECICGKCNCNEEWDVEGYTACECQASHDTCITPYGEHVGKLCSGHGTCQCGKCKCEYTEDGQYAGQYCDECPTCPGKCEEWKACVQCQAFNSGELFEQVDEVGTDKCSQCPFTPILVDKAEDMVQNDERLCTFFDDDYCRFSFVYGFRSTGELKVWVQEAKQCPVVVDVDNKTPGVPGKGTVDISVDISILVINALSVFISTYI